MINPSEDKPLILLVDDESAMSWLLANFLSDLYRVVTKPDGEEAINWISEGNTPSLIISDLSMPKVDGLEFLKFVRAKDALNKTPFLMLSAYDRTTEKVKCFQAGANDYLVKPFNPVELKARIGVMLTVNQRTA